MKLALIGDPVGHSASPRLHRGFLEEAEIDGSYIAIRVSGGEGAAAELVAKIGSKAEVARELCYRLYTLCERKKRTQEALSYNALVQSWPEITHLAREGDKLEVPTTAALFDGEERE